MLQSSLTETQESALGKVINNQFIHLEMFHQHFCCTCSNKVVFACYINNMYKYLLFHYHWWKMYTWCRWTWKTSQAAQLVTRSASSDWSAIESSSHVTSVSVLVSAGIDINTTDIYNCIHIYSMYICPCLLVKAANCQPTAVRSNNAPVTAASGNLRDCHFQSITFEIWSSCFLAFCAEEESFDAPHPRWWGNANPACC